MNSTKTFTKLWINPVMIIQKNSISSSHFKLFCRNWVPRKLPITPSRFYIFMLHIFYVLNVITKVVKFGIFCRLLLFVSLVWINYNTCLDYFAKLTTQYYSFSWTCTIFFIFMILHELEKLGNLELIWDLIALSLII